MSQYGSCQWSMLSSNCLFEAIHGASSDNSWWSTPPLSTSKYMADMNCAYFFQNLGSVPFWILTWYVVDPPCGCYIRSVEQLLFKCPQGCTIEAAEVLPFQHILGREARLLPTNTALQKLHMTQHHHIMYDNKGTDNTKQILARNSWDSIQQIIWYRNIVKTHTSIKTSSSTKPFKHPSSIHWNPSHH